MILATPSSHLPTGAGVTLDHLFRYAAMARADDIALIDPPNRATFTTGAPRALTYREADRAVTAIAARLRGLGLTTDNIVAMQLPNTVEGVLALLGVLRAGLVASPLPLLWRRADCAAAVTMVGARALIATARIGATDHGELAMYTAADAFTVGHVGLFGGGDDGVVPLDDVFGENAPDFTPLDRGKEAARDLAAVTWDVDPAGLLPVARSHVELMMAGFAIMLVGRFAAKTTILASLCLGSLAGIATTLATWLLARGTLVLHHPFDPAVMRDQILDHRCSLVILPGGLAVRCAEAGMFRDSAVDKVMAVWRTPERLAACLSWPASSPALMDVTVFGETGLFAAMRDADGKYADIRPGVPPRSPDTQAPVLIEAARTLAGTLALRGPMVPLRPYPGAVANADRRHDGDAYGFVDTGYPCRFAPGSGTLVVTGPPSGIVSVGGYRFVLAKLQEAVSRIEPGAMIAAFPDGLTGQRIAGNAAGREVLQDVLAQLGHSPLVVDAFRQRRSPDAARSAA
jgi:non-ribosomal peptide synthetase component E (peptide arylation enzyme)